MEHLLPDAELEEVFIRPAEGPGGQHVNKTSCGVRLSFRIADSTTLPEHVRLRLLEQFPEGKIVILSKETRSLARNRELARVRLDAIVSAAFTVPKKRKKTNVSRAQKEQRRSEKAKRSLVKANRKKPVDNG